MHVHVHVHTCRYMLSYIAPCIHEHYYIVLVPSRLTQIHVTCMYMLHTCACSSMSTCDSCKTLIGVHEIQGRMHPN